MSTDFSSIASGFGNGLSSPPSQGDSGTTIQHMVLCDKSVNIAGVKIPALLVAIIGGILVSVIISFLVTSIFGTVSTEVDFFLGLIRMAGIILIAYAIQKFGRIRNMYPGMWPCGLKPTQIDPSAQAVNQVLCKLGGIKKAACKLGGLSNLVQSVGGLPVLIKSSGGLACIINEYGTFQEFVCAMGGVSALQAQLPDSSDFYKAMGGGSCGNISMPMDGV